MADYFTHFSCTLDAGSADNVARAFVLREAYASEMEETDGVELGFDLAADPETGPGTLWISSDGYGEPEHVVAFVFRCAAAFDLTGRWGFVWALTCSRPRLDGFGGGAQLLDLSNRRSLACVDCAHWLAASLDPQTDPKTIGGFY